MFFLGVSSFPRFFSFFVCTSSLLKFSSSFFERNCFLFFALYAFRPIFLLVFFAGVAAAACCYCCCCWCAREKHARRDAPFGKRISLAVAVGSSFYQNINTGTDYDGTIMCLELDVKTSCLGIFLGGKSVTL